MFMKFKLACAQFAPVKKQVAANIAKMAEMTRAAMDEGVDILVFPEGATAGYFLEGGVLECALTTAELLSQFSAAVGHLEKAIDVVIGFYESDSGELYNSAAYLSLGPAGNQVVHVYRKFFLPTYGVFDEERFVGRGTEVSVFETRFGTASILICEDVWHSIMPTLAAVKGANLLLIPSASPARGFTSQQPSNLLTWQRLLLATADEHNVYIANAQLCGFEGGKGFPGGSMIVDPTGKLLIQGPMQDEHLVVAEADSELVELARSRSPLLSDLRSAWSDLVRIAGEA
jgi:N-carbamoylputrescine amidase